MRFVLARHGQTDANVARELSARPPGGPLTPLGQAQAAALGARLAGMDVTAVYSSVAVRARQTAASVAAECGLEFTVVEGVHEIDVGELEGRVDEESRERFRAVDKAWEAGDVDARMPGGESGTDVWNRFRPVIAQITGGATGTVVLVTHGGVMRIVAGALLGLPMLPAYVPNTGLVVLQSVDAGWELEWFDETVPEPGDVTAGGPAE